MVLLRQPRQALDGTANQISALREKAQTMRAAVAHVPSLETLFQTLKEASL